MSDDNKPTGVGGGIQVATAAEAATEAGWARPAASLQTPIDELRDQINAVIDSTGLDQHHRMMSQSKAAELLFWIRAGAGRA